MKMVIMYLAEGAIVHKLIKIPATRRFSIRTMIQILIIMITRHNQKKTCSFHKSYSNKDSKFNKAENGIFTTTETTDRYRLSNGP